MQIFLFVFAFKVFTTVKNEKKKRKEKKKSFITCPCHNHRVEAVGLSGLLIELRFLWVCEVCKNFVKTFNFIKGSQLDALSP